MSSRPAEAHASLTAASPGHGSSVDQAPTSAVLVFTEPIDDDLARAEAIVDGSANAVTLDPTVTGSTLTLPLPSLVDGQTVEVQWRVTSTIDGHITSGVTAFGVGVPAPDVAGAADTSTPVSPLEALGRWLFILAIALAVLDVTLRRGGTRASARLWWAAPAALGGAVVMGLAQWSVAAEPVGVFLPTAAGRIAVRRVAVAVALVLAALASRRSATRGSVAAVVAAAAAAVWIHAEAGHAGGARRLVALAIGIQWLHVAAACAWIGAVGAAFLATRQVGVSTRRLRWISRTAAGGAVLVAVTGIGLVLRSFTTPDEVLSTPFGRVLVAKVLLFAVVVVLAGRNHQRIASLSAVSTDGDTPGREDPGVVGVVRRTDALHRFVRAEGALLIAVLLGASVLASLVPPRSVALGTEVEVVVDRVPGAPTLYTVAASDHTVQVYVAPGTGPTGELHATFFDARGTEVAVEDVRLTLGGATVDDLRFLSPGHVVAPAETPLAGPTPVSVEATTANGIFVQHIIDIVPDDGRPE